MWKAGERKKSVIKGVTDIHWINDHELVTLTPPNKTTALLAMIEICGYLLVCRPL